jgi:hypothetical protein
VFFREEKNQKTFIYLGWGSVGPGQQAGASAEQKSSLDSFLFHGAAITKHGCVGGLRREIRQ